MLDQLIRIHVFIQHLLINYSITGVMTMTDGDLGTSFFSVTLFDTPGLNALGKLEPYRPNSGLCLKAQDSFYILHYIDACKMTKRRLFCDICK